MCLLFLLFHICQSRHRGIHLLSRTIDPSIETEFTALSTHETTANQYYFEVSGNLKYKSKFIENLVEANGWFLVAYIPYNTYILYGKSQSMKYLFEQNPEISWIGPVLPRDKIILPDNIDFSVSTVVVSVIDEAMVQHVRNSIGDVLLSFGRLQNASDIEIAQDLLLFRPTDAPLNIMREIIYSIAKIPAVKIVSARSQAESSNDYARALLESGQTVAAAYDKEGSIFNDYDLLGQAQIVGHSDTGIQSHCFFPGEWTETSFQAGASESTKKASVDTNAEKIVQYVLKVQNPDRGIHGTHTAGSVAGDPASKIHAGTAPKAKLAHFLLGNSYNIPSKLGNDLYDWGYQAGARIHTNSWGWSRADYGTEARDTDDFIFSHPGMAILFSVGNNCGKNKASEYLTPSNAKNVIAVGAIEYPGSPASTSGLEWVYHNSSKGPTADLRILPHVVAPGYGITSADGNSECGLLEKSGTSMATPLLAGVLAVVRQYYTEGWYPSGRKSSGDSFTPSAALLKNILINSGQELTGRHRCGMTENSESVP